ncbi:Uncharacterised protein [uncultured archaeon]|nr:Uncharacterised protein [uncultured archaeon]
MPSIEVVAYIAFIYVEITRDRFLKTPEQLELKSLSIIRNGIKNIIFLDEAVTFIESSL